MTSLSTLRENSGSSTLTGTIHIFDSRGDIGKIIRCSPLEILVHSSLSLRTALANHFRIRKRRVDVKRLGDPQKTTTYAVLKDQHDEDIAYLFLAGMDEAHPMLLAIPRRKSIQDIYEVIQDSLSSFHSKQLRLLREGHVLESGVLSDLDVRSLDTLQVVQAEIKKMNVIYYQNSDVRKKFHPEVPSTATVRDIRSALQRDISASNLKDYLESHDIIFSVGERVLADDNFQPHIDVLNVDGSIKSRKLNEKYFILQVFPKNETRIIIPLKYRRATDKRTKERGASIVVSSNASMKTVRDTIARFVSKSASAIRLCGIKEKPLHLSSLYTASLLQETVLYAEPDPAKTVFVVVRATPSGQETSIRVRLYNWDTVSDLKKTIAKEMNTHPELLCLEYGQQTLVEDDFLDAYRIQDKSTVRCRCYQLGVVITLFGRRRCWHRVLVHDSTGTTVGELQKWQQTLLQAPVRVTLVQHGRPLESDLSLAEAGVVFGDRLMVIRPQPVNAVRQPPPPCQRTFQTKESGDIEERFLSFPVKNNGPFYARRGIKLFDLEKETPSLGNSDCPGLSTANKTVEGICLLNESVSRCASRRRLSHSATNQTAEEGLSISENQSLIPGTLRNSSFQIPVLDTPKQSLARNQHPSLRTEMCCPSTTRKEGRCASPFRSKGHRGEIVMEPEDQQSLDFGIPNDREEQPQPRRLRASSTCVDATVCSHDTVQTTVLTTTIAGELKNDDVGGSGSDQTFPFPFDEEETERKYIADDNRPHCFGEPHASVDNKVQQKQLPHQDVVAPDPMHVITGEGLESGLTSCIHEAIPVSTSHSQRASAAEEEAFVDAETHNMNTPKPSQSSPTLGATSQHHGARSAADVPCHETSCQGSPLSTNVEEMENNIVELNDRREAAATTANPSCEEKTERKVIGCESGAQCSEGPHNVTNSQVHQEQEWQQLRNAAQYVTHVAAQEACSSGESATQSHLQTSNVERSKPTSALNKHDQSLAVPGPVFRHLPEYGSGISRASEVESCRLFEEKSTLSKAWEPTSDPLPETNGGNHTNEVRPRQQVPQNSRAQSGGGLQDQNRAPTEVCSVVDDTTLQNLSDTSTIPTMTSHSPRQHSAPRTGANEKSVRKYRRKTFTCSYPSKPCRMARKVRSKSMVHKFFYTEQEEEFVDSPGMHQPEIFPLKHGALRVTGTAEHLHTSQGDVNVWEDIFNSIADDLGGEWQKVCLGLHVRYKDIEAIKHKHPSNLFAAAFEGLMKWRQMKGSEARVEELQTVLESSGFRSIAEDISKKFPSVFC